jgi:hypothetical protein
MDDDEFFTQNHNDMGYGGDYNEDSQGEIDNHIFAQLEKKEEYKNQYQQQTNNNSEVYKYQPVR